MTLLITFQIVLWLLLLFYALVFVGLMVGLRRLDYQPSNSRPLVSVIVAARNEESHLAELLECLLRQDYSEFEIIVVNDRSTDGTRSIIELFQARDSRIQRIDIDILPQQMPAKKHALARGISLSKGELLCFTDADCFPPPRWISAVVAAFDDRTGLVAGYSPYWGSPAPRSNSTSEKGLLKKFVEYEEFKGATWAAGAIGLGLGWLCTGRSLAYRRRVYDELGGFERIKQSVSGDDDLFLQLIRRYTRWRIRYVMVPESFVPTIPPRGFGDFVRQRVRHFSAGKYFSASMKAFFFAFHATNLILLLSIIVSILFDLNFSLYLPFLFKCIVDTVVFFRAAPLFAETRYASSFLLMELLYVMYNSCIGPLGFTTRVEWKPETQ